MPPRPRWCARWHALSLIALPMLVGCGHPATHAECQAIFDKSAELELRAQNVTDPAVIGQRVAAVRAARGEELVGKCVGRRVTDRAVACVRQAETSEQVDRCLQ